MALELTVALVAEGDEQQRQEAVDRALARVMRAIDGPCDVTTVTVDDR